MAGRWLRVLFWCIRFRIPKIAETHGGGCMVALSLVFHCHVPWKPADFRARDLGGRKREYGDRAEMRWHFGRLAKDLFHPLFDLLARRSAEASRPWQMSFSFSQDFLRLAQENDAAMLEKIRGLVQRGVIDVVASPAFGGLVGIGVPEDFVAQVTEHHAALGDMFGVSPTVFHNSDLIYSDHVGRLVAQLGYRACLFEGVEALLPPGCSPVVAFHHPDVHGLLLLPRSRFLADELERRFSSSGVSPRPVSAEYHVRVIERMGVENLDFLIAFLTPHRFEGGPGPVAEFLGFVDDLLGHGLASQRIQFCGLSDLAQSCCSHGHVSVVSPTGQRGVTSDMSYWLGNSLQQDFLQRLVEVYPRVRDNPDFLQAWRSLFSGEVFEQMRFRFFDGTSSGRGASEPYETYIVAANIMEDMVLQCSDAVSPGRNAEPESEDEPVNTPGLANRNRAPGGESQPGTSGPW